LREERVQKAWRAGEGWGKGKRDSMWFKPPSRTQISGYVTEDGWEKLLTEGIN